jgi:hypothetical protein
MKKWQQDQDGMWREVEPVGSIIGLDDVEELPLMLRVTEHEGQKMVQMKFGDVLIHMDAQSAHELAVRLEQAAWQAR